MDPLAEFTKLEVWDKEGNPSLQEVRARFQHDLMVYQLADAENSTSDLASSRVRVP